MPTPAISSARRTGVKHIPDCHLRIDTWRNPDYRPDMDYRELRAVYHRAPHIYHFVVLIVKDGTVDIRPYAQKLCFVGKHHYMKTIAFPHLHYANGKCKGAILSELRMTQSCREQVLRALEINWIDSLPQCYEQMLCRPTVLAAVLKGTVVDEQSLAHWVKCRVYGLRTVDTQLWMEYVHSCYYQPNSRTYVSPHVLRDFTTHPAQAIRLLLSAKDNALDSLHLAQLMKSAQATDCRLEVDMSVSQLLSRYRLLIAESPVADNKCIDELMTIMNPCQLPLQSMPDSRYVDTDAPF